MMQPLSATHDQEESSPITFHLRSPDEHNDEEGREVATDPTLFAECQNVRRGEQVKGTYTKSHRQRDHDLDIPATPLSIEFIHDDELGEMVLALASSAKDASSFFVSAHLDHQQDKPADKSGHENLKVELVRCENKPA